jgi:hypothetical protein
MRIGAVTTAYNEESIIAGTLRCLAPIVDQHIVLLSEHPYYKPGTGAPDKTEDICNSLGVEVVKGFWPEEHLQRNLGRKLMEDFDWILWFDADEMITLEDGYKLMAVLENCDNPALAIISKVYWYSTDYRFDPYPTHHKIIATKPSVSFYDRACISSPYTLLKEDNAYGITHHHLSYCAPKDILNKVLHYSHANEFDGQKWYTEHFKNWRPGQAAVQPFGTKWRAVYDPLPLELKELLCPVSC